MEDYTTVLLRHEQKYLLTEEQTAALLARIGDRLRPDDYGDSVIHNLYYDTPTDRLIRQSLEKPVYKEKLRIRAYATPTADTTVFVELKKKFQGIVFKRRVAMPYAAAIDYLNGAEPPVTGQIVNEISQFCAVYRPLIPRVTILYDRQAFFDRDDPLLRVTFDRHIRYNYTVPDLTHPQAGTELLPEGQVLMEVKCQDAMPLWLAEALSACRIYPTSFSKYGEAYWRELALDGRVG